MSLNKEEMDALRAAVEGIDRAEDLESAVGREVRAADMEFQDYIHIMDLVRRISRRWGIDHMSAALRILEKQPKG